MKIVVYIGMVLILSGCSPAGKKPADTATLRSVLLEQLKNTHANQHWFVPVMPAVKNISADQANWSDSTENHSIGQLVHHLAFWNERVLISFHGNTPPDFNNNNQETFTRFDKNQWQQTITKLDSIQTAWEKAVEQASEEQLTKHSATVANVCSHNAYHTGQILYILKRNGWWNDAKRVK